MYVDSSVIMGRLAGVLDLLESLWFLRVSLDLSGSCIRVTVFVSVVRVIRVTLVIRIIRKYT